MLTTDLCVFADFWNRWRDSQQIDEVAGECPTQDALTAQLWLVRVIHDLVYVLLAQTVTDRDHVSPDVNTIIAKYTINETEIEKKLKTQENALYFMFLTSFHCISIPFLFSAAHLSEHNHHLLSDHVAAVIFSFLSLTYTSFFLL